MGFISEDENAGVPPKAPEPVDHADQARKFAADALVKLERAQWVESTRPTDLRFAAALSVDLAQVHASLAQAEQSKRLADSLEFLINSSMNGYALPVEVRNV